MRILHCIRKKSTEHLHLNTDNKGLFVGTVVLEIYLASQDVLEVAEG